jgi:hypothetical protein
MLWQKHGRFALLITMLGAACHAGSLDSLTEFDDGASSTESSGQALVRADEALGRDTETSTGHARDADDEPLEDDEPMESREQEVALGLAAAAEPVALGHECNATCTVVNLGADMCPETISGYGYTTFLGGCKKACKRARDDAASKLPVGCQINNCNLTGC